MPTYLNRGKYVDRVVPSNSHDARKTGRMVVRIENAGVAVIKMRPARSRHFVEYPVDALYMLAIRAEIAMQQRAKAKARKERRKQRQQGA